MDYRYTRRIDKGYRIVCDHNDKLNDIIMEQLSHSTGIYPNVEAKGALNIFTVN